MAQDNTTATNDGGQETGKYLTFVLGDETFGLEILKVREIIGMMDVTRVPLTPQFIEGIINLRGRVVPVMDLRTKFGMAARERDESTCIIVVYIGRTEIGIIVDRVCEVVDMAPGNIEDVPSFGSAVDTRFILGIGKIGQKVTLLLDIDKALTNQDMEALCAVAP